MTTRQRPPFIMGLGNAIATALMRLGFRMGPITLLTVRGRKSGQLRTTPIAVIAHEGVRYLLSVYGETDWVRNLRAAGGRGTLTRGRRAEAIRTVELTPAEAAPILKAISGGGPSFLRSYYATTPQSSLADFECEAPRHPLFRVEPGSARGAGAR